MRSLAAAIVRDAGGGGVDGFGDGRAKSDRIIDKCCPSRDD